MVNPIKIKTPFETATIDNQEVVIDGLNNFAHAKTEHPRSLIKPAYRLCSYGEWPDGEIQIYRDPESGIPMVHYKWVPHYFVTLSLDTKVAYAKANETGKADRYKYCYAVPIGPVHRRYQMDSGDLIWSHVRLCNFRRYSWSWADNDGVKHGAGFGFGGGVTYANNCTGGIPCESREQVIRETLVKTLADMEVPDGLKYHHSVQPMYEWLVQEALRNMTRHVDTAVKGGNGACGGISINGVHGHRIEDFGSVHREVFDLLAPQVEVVSHVEVP